MPARPDACYVRKEGVVQRRIAGETFLVPVSGKLADLRQIYSLSQVGELIWSRLDGSAQLETIVRDIIDAYEVEPRQAETDAREFVEDLLEAGLAAEQG